LAAGQKAETNAFPAVRNTLAHAFRQGESSE
jgi:hypothetical protein